MNRIKEYCIRYTSTISSICYVKANSREEAIEKFNNANEYDDKELDVIDQEITSVELEKEDD